MKKCEGIDYKTVIARLCVQRKVRHYFEIGVAEGVNLMGVSAPVVTCVDPYPILSVDFTKDKGLTKIYRKDSDSFFLTYAGDNFDFAFLDGMHLFEYLLRDFYNSERFMDRNGLILMHDCLPSDDVMISRRNNGQAWTGDVWKIVPILREYRPDLKVIALDASPTGLVCVTNLDPSSKVLQKNYLDITEKYNKLSNNAESLEQLYASIDIMSAQEIVSDNNQSRFFVT